MRQLKNEKGIALLTALMFTLLTLAIIMTLLYMLTQGIKISTASKSYKTSLEASYGAAELISKDILPLIFSSYTSAASMARVAGTFPASLNMTTPNSACFAQKTQKNTAQWDAGVCAADTKSVLPTTLPDMTFVLKAKDDDAGFKVYAKITDTRCGGDPSIGQPCTNSDAGGIEGLDTGGGVASTAMPITVERKPAYYSLEIQGERASNPREKSKLSVLYAY
jgi:hypothetical protein